MITIPITHWLIDSTKKNRLNVAKKKTIKTSNTTLQNNNPNNNLFSVYSLTGGTLFSIESTPCITFSFGNKNVLEIKKNDIIWYSGDTQIVVQCEDDLKSGMYYLISKLCGVAPNALMQSLKNDAKEEVIKDITDEIGIEGWRMLKINKLRNKN